MRSSIALAVALLSAASARPADPPPPSPEQKVLDRFVGTWRTTYTVSKTEWTPEAKVGSATISFGRVLGGAYLQEKSEHSDKSSSLTMWTYDAERKSYRAWWFSSAGHSSESTGAWDGGTKTFTWKATTPTFTTTARQRFTDDNTYEWDVLVKGDSGNVLYKMEGKSTRMPAR